MTSHAPNSQAARDIDAVFHPMTNLAQHLKTGPMTIQSGKGIYVYDSEGKEYIEGLAGLWCVSLGYGEEELIDAATEQLKQLSYGQLFASRSTDPVIDLAEKLKAMVPIPKSKIFFGNSGSDANDTQVKLVWYYNNAMGRPEKKKVISRMRGYHGVTVAAASMTGLPAQHIDFDMPAIPVVHTDCPHYYRGAEPGETEEEFATRMALNLEGLIEREGPDTIAAFIAEPVMGAGGVIPPPPTYFEKIQRVLKEHDIIFIDDEVICGFGRTGNMFGAETYDLQPDTMSMAKALSSAYLPISAVAVKDELFQTYIKQSEKIGVFGHGYTYSGHPVCAAVALRAMQLMEERKVVAHVREVAPRFLARLHGFSDHPLVGEARGVGLVGALELVKNKSDKTPFDPNAGVGAKCQQLALENGLIVRGLVDSVALCPPLIIDESEIVETFDRLGRALDGTEKWARQEGLL